MESRDIKALLDEEKARLEGNKPHPELSDYPLPSSVGSYELQTLVYAEESVLLLNLKRGEKLEPIFHLYPHRERTAIIRKGTMPSGCLGRITSLGRIKNMAWNRRIKKVRQHLGSIGYSIMESDNPSYKITTRRYMKS